jgi:hypothetical protein
VTLRTREKKEGEEEGETGLVRRNHEAPKESAAGLGGKEEIPFTKDGQAGPMFRLISGLVLPPMGEIMEELGETMVGLLCPIEGEPMDGLPMGWPIEGPMDGPMVD